MVNEAVHNLIVHPLMAALPTEWAIALHDWHANFIFGGEKFDEITIEGVENASDFFHNAVVHPLMCLLPPEIATLFHDAHVRRSF